MINIVIIGVGGQGTLLASKVLGALAVQQDKDVKISEVHGMAQRGGSVITHVRIGNDIHAPLIDAGGADYVIAFERLEALRALPYLRKDGLMIVNTQSIMPMPVIIGAAVYPDDIFETIKASGAQLISIDADAIAKQAGSPRSANIALLGVLSRFMKGTREQWLRAVETCVPEKSLAANKTAFAIGAEA